MFVCLKSSNIKGNAVVVIYSSSVDAKCSSGKFILLEAYRNYNDNNNK